MNSSSRGGGLPPVLLIPSALLLILQGFGIGATDSQLHPVFKIPAVFYTPIVGAGIFLSLLSPVTSAIALFAAFAERPRSWVVLICAMFVATSCFGCFWTVLSHPTWTQGYSGGR